jgi:hypothetical protein
MEITRLEEMVLDAIANDFEDLSQIVRDVTEFGLGEKVAVERADVIFALCGLMQKGFADGYRLAGEESPRPVRIADWGSLEELYFFRTDRGKTYLTGLAEREEPGREK